MGANLHLHDPRDEGPQVSLRLAISVSLRIRWPAGQLGKLCGVDRERHAEEPLGGGNVSAGVVRVGDTVRRPVIRDFHDAVTGFVAPAGARWQVLIPAEGTGDIIAHHDLAP